MISYELLGNMMCLSNHRITAIVPQSADDVASQRFGIIVEGSAMPVHIEGASVYRLTWNDNGIERRVITED
jgi:hypothetical protein